MRFIIVIYFMPGKKFEKESAIRKHYKIGIELEMFTLDKKGYVSNNGEKFIKKLEVSNPELGIKKECGSNMLELESLPEIYVPDLMEEVVGKLEKLLVLTEKENLFIYPFGTYPGAFTPKISQGRRYILQQKLFGKQKFMIAARCCGLHCHYSLPWGMFDGEEKDIKNLVKSKNKESLLNIYNLFIAMDPALTTFTQSSPFYQGKFLGKDSRVVVYRGGQVFNYPQGLYADYEKFGGLQGYVNTNTDLQHVIQDRYVNWDSLLEKFSAKAQELLKHGSRLDTTWNPVKINAHGTTEQRGMDANYPSVIVAVCLLIKYISLQVQEQFIKVAASDEAVKQPFKYENGSILIPPDSHVINYLQPKAALEGLANEDVYNYCAALFRLGKIFVPEDRLELLQPLKNMLDEKKTVSDKILSKAKSLGVKLEEGISESKAAELALYFSEQLREDVFKTKQALEKFHSSTNVISLSAALISANIVTAACSAAFI